MAEIDIEKKKPIWPWIILVLIILAILYFLFFASDDENDAVDNTDNTERVEDTTIWENEEDTTVWDPEADTLSSISLGEASEYLAFIDSKSGQGLNHDYIGDSQQLHLLNVLQDRSINENSANLSEMQESLQGAPAADFLQK